MNTSGLYTVHRVGVSKGKLLLILQECLIVHYIVKLCLRIGTLDY